MLLAIDAGNTHIVCGLWDGKSWVGQWRRSTVRSQTEDEIAAWLVEMFRLSGFDWKVDQAVCGSVVPELDQALALACRRWLGIGLVFIRASQDLGLPIEYDPVHAVGADRVANALGALSRHGPPIIVVDFGTATTFDVIDERGVYVGGAILPGVQISSEALFSVASKLPSIALVAPKTAIGKSTVHSLQAGIVLGYSEAIDGMAKRIISELGVEATVIATGGLGKIFLDTCQMIRTYDEALTLDGLRICIGRLATFTMNES